MGKWKEKSEENKIFKELLNRIHEQERISINDAIDDYLEPKNTYGFLLARRKMAGIFAAIKRNLLKQGIPFGCLNGDGEFGIPTDENEFNFAIMNRYKLVKGITINSSKFVGSAKRYGFLKSSEEEEVTIVKILPEGEEDDNNKAD